MKPLAQVPSPLRWIIGLSALGCALSFAGAALALETLSRSARPILVTTPITVDPEGVVVEWKSGPFTNRVIQVPREDETPEELDQRTERIVDLRTKRYPAE